MIVLTPETIYQRLPISLQHVAISLKGIDLRLRRASTKVMGQELERLRRRESWTAAQFDLAPGKWTRRNVSPAV